MTDRLLWEHLDRIERMLATLLRQQSALVRSLAEEEEGEELLTLDGGTAGAERDTSTPL